MKETSKNFHNDSRTVSENWIKFNVVLLANRKSNSEQSEANQFYRMHVMTNYVDLGDSFCVYFAKKTDEMNRNHTLTWSV